MSPCKAFKNCFTITLLILWSQATLAFKARGFERLSSSDLLKVGKSDMGFNPFALQGETWDCKFPSSCGSTLGGCLWQDCVLPSTPKSKFFLIYPVCGVAQLGFGFVFFFSEKIVLYIVLGFGVSVGGGDLGSSYIAILTWRLPTSY